MSGPAAAPRSRTARFTRAVRWRAVALLAALGVAGFALGYLGTWPPVATVMSGSMAPEIGTGDMVVFKRIAEPPRVGDIVAVSVPDEARTRYGYPAQVVHRVVRVAANGAVTTKGDAKPSPDPFTVRASSIRTKVLFSVPAAGRAIAFLSSPMGLLWLAAGAVMLVGLPLLERRQESEQAEQAALEAVRAELHTISEELAKLRLDQPPEPEPRLPVVDWTELETIPEPATPEPEPEPVTYTVRRRSGGLLGRLR